MTLSRTYSIRRSLYRLGRLAIRKLLPGAARKKCEPLLDRVLLPCRLANVQAGIDESGAERLCLKPAALIEYCKPESAQPLPASFAFRSRHFQSLNACMLRNAFVHQSFILDAGRRFIPELSYPTLFPQLARRKNSVFRSENPQYLDEDAVFLGNTVMDNYYHWSQDALAQLMLLPGFQERLILAPLNAPYKLESLLALGIARERIHDFEPVSLLRCRSVTAFIPPPAEASHPECILSLRRLRQIMHVAPGSDERLYISRGDAKQRRGIENEQELEASLLRRGFRSVTLGGKSMAEQIALFSGASCIILPHGAALSNLSFCQPGTRVLEITSPGSAYNHVINTFAHTLRLRYHLFVAGRLEDICAEKTSAADRSFSLDMKEFTKALEKFLNDDARHRAKG